MADVLVIGDVMVDVVTRPEGPLQHGSDVRSRIRAVGGGSAANTACWLAAIGQHVRLVAVLGHDLTGSAAQAELDACGVTFAGRVVDGASTGVCVVLVDPDGERTMLPDRGANDLLTPDDVDRALDRTPAWLHVSGYTLLGEGSRAAAQRAIERARADAIPFSVDASSASPLLALGGAQLLDWSAGARVLFANDDELQALDGPEPALRRVDAVVAKHGPAGASWLEMDRVDTAPAIEVPVVDSVGAGDALDAGVIDALLRGETSKAAIEHGLAVAARVVAATGARPRPDR